MPGRKPWMPREREVLRSVMQALDALGCMPTRRNIRNDPISFPDGTPALDDRGRPKYARSELSGLPDVSATIPKLGTRLEVEVKAYPNRPTPLQYRRLDEFNRVGALAVWVNDIEWLIWAVEHFKKGAKTRVDRDGESVVFYP